jgi:CO/xanthine dehydrogenase Mo-binding subunit
LLAEQLFVSGCRFLISVTSAGQIVAQGSPPYFVVIDSFCPGSSRSVRGGRFAANLEELAQRIRDDGFAARRPAAAERGRLRGLGIACFLETSRGTPGERAEIRFEADQPTGLEVRPTRWWRGMDSSFLFRAR